MRKQSPTDMSGGVSLVGAFKSEGRSSVSGFKNTSTSAPQTEALTETVNGAASQRHSSGPLLDDASQKGREAKQWESVLYSSQPHGTCCRAKQKDNMPDSHARTSVLQEVNREVNRREHPLSRALSLPGVHNCSEAIQRDTLPCRFAPCYPQPLVTICYMSQEKASLFI